MGRLIDADALLNRMQKDPLFDLVERYGVSGVIKAEPTVDAEPVRHGTWIPVEDDDMFCCCSECGTHEYRETIEVLHYDFCPNCGAKMDGERKEE